MSVTYKMRKTTKRIILHDSHTEPPYDTYWLGEARREALVMGLLDTGYHFIIERDGTVFEIRPRQLIGSHTPQNNMDSIGICLVGGREGGQIADNFEDTQFVALESLVCELFDEFGMLKVQGHDEALRHKRRGAECPAFSAASFRNYMLMIEDAVERHG